jgi:hypothetical protein
MIIEGKLERTSQKRKIQMRLGIINKAIKHAAYFQSRIGSDFLCPRYGIEKVTRSALQRRARRYFGRAPARQDH